ncbi:mastermind-like protein 2 [Anguilla anguilla]|uniref:mastermind-like protein 2 n=1 Tax=Anguilla anguilla TaxID=7936 RepID=UPI0015AC81A8|nr:mastermind-like protein 2 [Anguilla anguilla]
MGDAALPQPAAGGFVPMLGVGMVGSVPGTVAEPVCGTRGSVVPPLHNAIVERLRARIESCRRHHSSCESRYQRGQAETSDREHENTLHLLNIVNQGPGHRKPKANKATTRQPSEYNSKVNGEQKSLHAVGCEPKNSTRIALQGSLRRKIEGQPLGYNVKQNGLSGGAFGPDFKRVCLEGGAMGHSGCAFINGQSHSRPGEAPMSHGLQRKDRDMMAPPMGGDLFSLTLKEMKKEPGEVHSCGQPSAMDPAAMVFDFKEEGDGQIDPELQDLFDELTKSVPSLNDLELEKILKQDDDDAFGLELGRPSSAGAGRPCGQLERAIKTEYSPGYGHAHSHARGHAPVGSPQLRPASAGPTLSSTVSMATHNPGQGSQGLHCSLTGWTEGSRAEQLKQIAANQQQQQQPGPSLRPHPQQQSQPGAAANWSPAVTPHSTPGTFGQEKTPSQQTLSPQHKGMSNCLFKLTGSGNGGSSSEMKALGSKPLSHFSHKPHTQQSPLMGAPQNKPPLHYQNPQEQQQPRPAPSPNSHQPQHPQHFHNPALPACQQPKPPLTQRMPLNQHGSGLHFKVAQQRQALPPGSRLPSNMSFGSRLTQAQQSPATASNQPKVLGKNQAMQRQLALQQQIVPDSDKINPQDQLSRHLTRPPPDYKQPRRNMVGVQQANLYKGSGLPLSMNSSQAPTSTMSSQSALQTSSCHVPTGQGTKMTAAPNDRRFASRPDPSQGRYSIQTVNQLQQLGNQNPVGPNHNSMGFPGPGILGGAFGSGPGSNGQNIRPPGGQETAGMPRQRLMSMLTGNNNVGAPLNWGQGSKQTPLGLRRFPGPLLNLPHSGACNIRGPNFPQRPMVPPNQMTPDTPMLPLNQVINGHGVGPKMAPLPTVANLNQSSPTLAPPSMGTFGNSSTQNGRGYHSNQSGDLTFDFLQDGDNTVPGINSDSDFIDSLLKSGPGNDDWMKDINLDEILGSHS